MPIFNPSTSSGSTATDPITHTYAPGSLTIPTLHYVEIRDHIVLRTTERLTIQGSGRLRLT